MVVLMSDDMSRTAYDKPSSEWPDGKVVVSKARTRNKVTKYHTTRCRVFPSSPMFMRLENIKSWKENYEDEEWKECAICAGDDTSPNRENWSEYALGRKNSGGNIDD